MFRIPTVTNDLEDIREMKKAYVHVHTKRAHIIRNSRKTEYGAGTMNGKIEAIDRIQERGIYLNLIFFEWFTYNVYFMCHYCLILDSAKNMSMAVTLT